MDTDKRYSLLNLIEKDAQLTEQQIANMLGLPTQEITQEIAALKREGIIKGYKTLVDWERTGRDVVVARIEIQVTPKANMGFEETAYIVSQFQEVETCYLMSGGYDLALTVTGKSFKEIALFVAHRLAPIEAVQSTSTHFVLRKYKERGVMMVDQLKDEREVTFL